MKNELERRSYSFGSGMVRQRLPELEGKRYMSLNWIDANNADQYQVGKVNVDVVDENKNESIMEE